MEDAYEKVRQNIDIVEEQWNNTDLENDEDYGDVYVKEHETEMDDLVGKMKEAANNWTALEMQYRGENEKNVC